MPNLRELTEEEEEDGIMVRAKALRLVRNLRSSEAADLAGIPRFELSRIEQGWTESRPSLIALAIVYGVKVETMMDKVRLKVVPV